MRDRVILSHGFVIFSSSEFLPRPYFGKRSETEYSDESRVHVSCTRGLLYSGILRQLVCETPAYPRTEFPTQKEFTSAKVTSRFSPRPSRAADPYGPFPLPWLSPPRFGTSFPHCRSNGPILPCSYLNSRSTLSQVLFRWFSVEEVYREL